MFGLTTDTFCVSLRDFLRIQHCAWFDNGNMHCVSLRSFLKKLNFFYVLVDSGSPYSALCLVQQRIHALRQSTVAWVFHGVSPWDPEVRIVCGD